MSFPPFPHPAYLVFVALLGACVGSFLNVVVWRLPREESLVSPPSHCPNCNNVLPWYDNIPVFGWIKLGGKCRFCKTAISPRYPIVEAATAGMFVFYYVMFYVVGVDTCPPAGRALFPGARPVHVAPEWPMFALYLFLASALLAASLIDAEWFIIPEEIPWLVAGVGVAFHALFDHPYLAGAVNAVTAANAPSPTAALGAGGAVGLGVSLLLWRYGWMPKSFPDGDPELEVEREENAGEGGAAKSGGGKDADPPPKYTPRQIRLEMRKEMLFILPPMVLAVAWYLLTDHVPGLRGWWLGAVRHHWVSGLLGSVYGGLVGGFVVWVTRILGTIVFGRVAMGLGDVDLMLAVGAVLGAGAATVAFFLAPFFGILVAVYLLLSGSRKEIPFGPYLSLASGCVMLFYCQIVARLIPGV